MSYGLIIRDDKQSNMILGHDCGRYPCAVFKLEDDSIDFVKDIWDGFDAAKEIDCPLMEAYDIKIVACRNKEFPPAISPGNLLLKTAFGPMTWPMPGRV
ncbi:MAG: hypothetical protein IIW69_03480 [Bacteroidaceae bacterium]|nr:hypothetical protein [Bacteroidaceae bacterium]